MNANIISGSEQIGNIWRSRQRPAGRLWQTRINIQLLRFVANNSISKQTYTTQPALRIMERMLAFSIYTIDQFPNQFHWQNRYSNSIEGNP